MRLALIFLFALAGCEGTTGDVLVDRDPRTKGDLAGADLAVSQDLGAMGDLSGLAPMVVIVRPTDGTTIVTGNPVDFVGHATDPTDGALTGAALVWTSDLEGTLGMSEILTAQIDQHGMHTITLTATNSLKLKASAQITLIAP